MFPLQRTINICADTFYDNDSFTREVFMELTQTANKSVEFSLTTPYRPTDK